MTSSFHQFSDTLVSFIAWWQKGMAHALPHYFVNLGYRTYSTFVENGDTQVLEKSILGLNKISSKKSNHTTDKATICLRRSEYHQLTVTLPKSASGRLTSALALKLNEASPINPSKIFYGFKKIGRDNHHNIILSVSLARRTTINKIIGNYQGLGSAISVVANPNNDLNDLYNIYTHQNNNKTRYKNLTAIIAIIGACLIASTGISRISEEKKTVLSLYERKLITSIKKSKKQSIRLAEHTSAKHSSRSYASFSAALMETLTRLPQSFIITSIKFDNTDFEIHGFIPNNQQIMLQTQFESTHFTPSDRPGYAKTKVFITKKEQSS